jgi:recombination protein RecT
MSDTNTATAPAVKQTPTKQLTLRDQLQGPAFLEAVKKSLPSHLKPDRFVRIALTAMTKTPKLAQCSQSSVFGCLLQLSQYGLEPDGRRAHLIPYGDTCTLIIDWKGLAELAMRSGLVSSLHADIVHEGDIFEYNAGVVCTHTPHFLRRDAEKPAASGAVYAVYAIARFKDGSSKADVLSIDEVDAIRARSKSGRSGPWVTDFNEMAKKTAFRRLSKWLPLSPEFRDAVEADDEGTPIDIAATTVSAEARQGFAALLADPATDAPAAATDGGAA